MTLLIGLAAAALQPATLPEAGPARAVVQARASVRIVRPGRVAFDGGSGNDALRAQTAIIRVDGSPITAKLVEFE